MAWRFHFPIRKYDFNMFNKTYHLGRETPGPQLSALGRDSSRRIPIPQPGLASACSSPVLSPEQLHGGATVCHAESRNTWCGKKEAGLERVPDKSNRGANTINCDVRVRVTSNKYFILKVLQ